ncbi:hypothetical protein [Photobacterium piscicola]|uniref:hypothetical protein n=1 Tax=Photobacterium piscicola TaxID=1378299 RepID=UPI003736FF06
MKITDWLIELDLILGLSALALIGALSQAASTDSMTFKHVIAGVIMSTFVLTLVWLALANIEMNETLRLVCAGVAGYSAKYILAAWNIGMNHLANDPMKALTWILKMVKRK